jgi:siroheme synthase
MSHSTSALGTSAATESITIILTAHDLANSSAICSACSPLSGCDNNKLSVSTQSVLAYAGSRACSASIKAATSHLF